MAAIVLTDAKKNSTKSKIHFLPGPRCRFCTSQQPLSLSETFYLWPNTSSCWVCVRYTFIVSGESVEDVASWHFLFKWVTQIRVGWKSSEIHKLQSFNLTCCLTKSCITCTGQSLPGSSLWECCCCCTAAAAKLMAILRLTVLGLEWSSNIFTIAMCSPSIVLAKVWGNLSLARR